MLDTMGLTPKAQHRKTTITGYTEKYFDNFLTSYFVHLGCPIPLADDPNIIVIPKRTPDTIPKTLSYIMEDEEGNNSEKSQPLFGGHQSWLQRENSFKLNTTMKVDMTLTMQTSENLSDIISIVPTHSGFIISHAHK